MEYYSVFKKKKILPFVSTWMKLQRRQWHPNPVLLPGKSHGWRSLVGCSPWGREESDKSERLHFHFSLSCIGKGNENPLQCSFLENPRDRGAWWAAVHGVAQSRIRLKQLSSSSIRMNLKDIMLSKISQAQKTNTTWSHLQAESKIVKLIEAESRMVVAKDWGEKGMGRCLSRTRNKCICGFVKHLY